MTSNRPPIEYRASNSKQTGRLEEVPRKKKAGVLSLISVSVAAMFLLGAVAAAFYVVVSDNSDPLLQSGSRVSVASAVDDGVGGQDEADEFGESDTTSPVATEPAQGQRELATGLEPSTTTTAPPTSPPATNVLDARLIDNTVVISGEVPSTEVEPTVIEFMETVLGTRDWQSELTVNPSVAQPNSVTLGFSENVLFEPGDDEVQASFFPFLDRIIELMDNDPAISLLIEGHSDSQGNQVNNLALSQRRADAARAYIIERGINEFRVEALGRGDTEPVNDNETIDGRQVNRRLEIQMIGLRLEAS